MSGGLVEREEGTHCEARVGVRRNGGLAVGEAGDKVPDVEDRNEVDVNGEELERRKDVARKVESAKSVSSRLRSQKKYSPVVDASLGEIPLVENVVQPLSEELILADSHVRRDHVLAQLRSRVDSSLGRRDELIRKLLLLDRRREISLGQASRRRGAGRRSVGVASESDDAVQGSRVHASVDDEGAEEGEDIGREEVKAAAGSSVPA